MKQRRRRHSSSSSFGDLLITKGVKTWLSQAMKWKWRLQISLKLWNGHHPLFSAFSFHKQQSFRHRQVGQNCFFPFKTRTQKITPMCTKGAEQVNLCRNIMKYSNGVQEFGRMERCRWVCKRAFMLCMRVCIPHNYLDTWKLLEKSFLRWPKPGFKVAYLDYYRWNTLDNTHFFFTINLLTYKMKHSQVIF